jgi:hypothetical protein
LGSALAAVPSMNRPWISLGACFERPVSFDRTKQQFETSNWKHRGKYEMWEVHKCEQGNLETGYGICPFGEEPYRGTRWNCWPTDTRLRFRTRKRTCFRPFLFHSQRPFFRHIAGAEVEHCFCMLKAGMALWKVN